ncbi:hypothetical protein SAMN04487893_104113 [Myroides guanonis]|uniref:Uncharacterized protein n=2 Tax=Myroides guanonis TaxID=1150112 RepID=A0A1I3PFX0_9FLAO|nr:hypothetical protein SAMN04487893_104113 [Myroides guanonis]
MLFMFSCTSVEDEDLYVVKFKNNSEHPLTLKLKNLEQLIDSLTILPNETTPEYVHSKINNEFKGYFHGDFIQVTFDNGKGYICDKTETTNLCFTTKGSPLYSENPTGFIIKGNVYTYEITQDDYEKAHDLSE